MKLFIITLLDDIYYLYNFMCILGKNFICNLYEYNFNKDFFYNRLSSNNTTYTQFQKNYIKDIIFKNI